MPFDVISRPFLNSFFFKHVKEGKSVSLKAQNIQKDHFCTPINCYFAIKMISIYAIFIADKKEKCL